MSHGLGFWVLQIVGWVLVAWLTLTQCVSAVLWDQALEWGLQEGPEQVTEVGGAFLRGFAFSDLVFYVPLLAIGLIGHARDTTWSRTALAAALGITVYWPIVMLGAVVAAHGAPGWALESENLYWVVLPPIALWGLWGLWGLGHVTRTGRA